MNECLKENAPETFSKVSVELEDRSATWRQSGDLKGQQY